MRKFCTSAKNVVTLKLDDGKKSKWLGLDCPMLLSSESSSKDHCVNSGKETHPFLCVDWLPATLLFPKWIASYMHESHLSMSFTYKLMKQ